MDSRAEVKKKILCAAGFPVERVSLIDVYTIDAKLSGKVLSRAASMVCNPVLQKASVSRDLAPADFDWAVEIGYLPGVMDPVGLTVREGIEDILRLEGKMSFSGDQQVYSSQVIFISGKGLDAQMLELIASDLSNPLIQRVSVVGADDFRRNLRSKVKVPRVKLSGVLGADIVSIVDASDADLVFIGKEGISNRDGTGRGPLALDLSYMKAIQAYFRAEGRNPTDVELESIAQTWSEHCKHTIFADPIDDIAEGLFKRFIRGATERVREERGGRDFCVSVFTDNSGGIIFDDDHLLTHKVETHNSPSALDPFGGSITGIVGVNRDALGFGLGAKPVINQYGFCFGDPDDSSPLFRSQDMKNRMLSPMRMLEGVVEGVNVGGNTSGIPTPQGFVYFDRRYKGKPLVFVGTAGLIPREHAGKPLHEKRARPGDYIVMVGGRVGKDGIHGATFSSEAMDRGSPVTAVQIGDPITQKKMSDALVKEARDLGLYSSITDDGAGGLSCSVAEMAKESGGCVVDLDKVPTKYSGLAPWEIWISESQERMTLSVPKESWDSLRDLFSRRGVEAEVIGEFTDSGRCVVSFRSRTVMDVGLDFLHDGLPKRKLKCAEVRESNPEPILSPKKDYTNSLLAMLSRKNIAGFRFISGQFDHEVQGGSVLKPLQGRGLINGDATVTRPLLSSRKGVVLAQGMYPSYSDIDTYHMAACSIDTAIRNAVCAGADPDHLALLDNFCWSSSNEPRRLYELRRACEACYDYALVYGTPFISGKDSMFNDFKGFDEDGNPVKISVPPTLLVTAVGVMADAAKAVSLDLKIAGDLVYLVGETFEEFGGSEYFAMVGDYVSGKPFVGNVVPQVDAMKNSRVYHALSRCIDEGIIASAQSVGRGGLAVALAKSVMGGMLGLDIKIGRIPGTVTRHDHCLYSESQGRAVVSVARGDSSVFERIFSGLPFVYLGTVQDDPVLDIFAADGRKILSAGVEGLLEAYRAPFMDY
jgi:phosphoribosylformylglycinamidine synthase